MKMVKKAVKVQIREAKQQARNKAKEILLRSVSSLITHFREECQVILDSFEFYKEEMRRQDIFIVKLKNIILKQETMLGQYNNYCESAGLIVERREEAIIRAKSEK
jgi:hypothetical protein